MKINILLTVLLLLLIGDNHYCLWAKNHYIKYSEKQSLFRFHLPQEQKYDCKMEVQQGFDYQRFKGVWYELMRDKGYTQHKSSCLQYYYYEQNDGSMALNITANHIDLWDGQSPKIINRQMTWPAKLRTDRNLTSILKNGQLEAKFTKFAWTQHNILRTDYDSYALMHTCKLHRTKHTLFFRRVREDHFWIITRKPLDLYYSAEEFNEFLIPDVAEYKRIQALHDIKNMTMNMTIGKSKHQ